MGQKNTKNPYCYRGNRAKNQPLNIGRSRFYETTPFRFIFNLTSTYNICIFRTKSAKLRKFFTPELRN